MFDFFFESPSAYFMIKFVLSSGFTTGVSRSQ